MHLNTPFLFLKFKNFLRRGHTPSCTHPLGASTFAPLALTHAPPTRKLATSLYLSYNKQHKIQNKFKINNEIGTDVICKDSLRRHSAVTEHARNIAGMATRNLTHKWHQSVLTWTYLATGLSRHLGMCTFWRFASFSSPTPPVYRPLLCPPNTMATT